MQSIKINATGEIEEQTIDRRAVAKEFGMHVRDLRPVFTFRQLATISSRGKGIILNFGVIKMVIGADKTYIFNVGNQDVKGQLVPSIVAAITNNEERVPYEFLLLEISLFHRFSKLRNEYELLEKEIEISLQKAQKLLDDKSLEKLLNIKKILSKFSTTVEELEEILRDILEDDAEMVDFYLSKEAPEDSDFSDLESVLENFAEPAEEISNKLDDLRENIEDTQEFIGLKLSNRRNLIIRFDLVATMVTAIFSLLALITGIYGMNLRNNFGGGGDTGGFWFVAGLLFFIGLFLCALTWFWMKKKDIF